MILPIENSVAQCYILPIKITSPIIYLRFNRIYGLFVDSNNSASNKMRNTFFFLFLSTLIIT